jgi:hypothetical protein
VNNSSLAQLPSRHRAHAILARHKRQSIWFDIIGKVLPYSRNFESSTSALRITINDYNIITEEDMDHPLIGRPVLDEIGFAASQHLDSVRDKFHLHDFSHIGEELLDIGKQPLGALSKLLLMPAEIPEFIEDLPDVLALAKKKT